MTPTRLSPCRAYRASIDAWIDGLMTASQRGALEQHALGCRRCASSLKEATQLRAILDAASVIEPRGASDDAFIERVMAGIESGGVDSQAGSEGRWPELALAPQRSAVWSRVIVLVSAAAGLALWALWPQALEEEAPVTLTQAQIQAQAPAEPEAPSEEAGLFARLRPDALDTASFREALDAALAEVPFDPWHDVDSSAWSVALERALGRDRTARSSRRLLRSRAAADPLMVALAARCLGPVADYQDRRLLAEGMEDAGAACALALAERGASGLAILWNTAAGGGGESNAAARECLMRLASGGHAEFVNAVRLDQDVEFGAQLLAALPEQAEQALLERFLEGGQAPWLDALVDLPGAESALALRLKQSERRLDSTRLPRLLTVIERTGAPAGTWLAIRSLERGDSGAIRALANIRGVEPLRALALATSEETIPSELEERAWASIGDARANALGDFLRIDESLSEASLGVVLDRIGLAAGLSSGLTAALIRFGASTTALTAHRRSALISAVDALHGSAVAEPLATDETILSVLRSCCESADSHVAAAAWLALAILRGDALEPPDEEIVAALRRPGSTHVRHLRVIRALEKTRAARNRRSL